MKDKRNTIWLKEELTKIEDRFNSSTICTAKWLQSTTMLFNGFTHSCHHCPTHRIDPDQVVQYPDMLHNTSNKLFQRHDMLDDIRPSDCSYCWNIEDQGSVSDRAFKSTDKSWSTNNLDRIVTGNNYPSYFEVSFDSTCNLKCMYCSPEVSSKWMEEIQRFGPYPTSGNLNNLEYLKQKNRIPIKNSEYNPYIEAFWKWWPDLIKHLNVFRVTGGEPLLSKHVWKVFDYINEYPQPQLELGVNTNLSVDTKIFNRFIDKVKQLESNTKQLQIYTSCEATGAHAEYIRYGLDYEQFKLNCEAVLANTNTTILNFMTTISALSLPTLESFSKWLIELRNKYKGRVVFSYSMLRWPDFMDLRILPKEISLPYLTSLDTYLKASGEPVDSVRVQRLISYAKQDLNQLERLKQDFKIYYNEYDKRRGTNFKDTFPELSFMLD